MKHIEPSAFLTRPSLVPPSAEQSPTLQPCLPGPPPLDQGAVSTRTKSARKTAEKWGWLGSTPSRRKQTAAEPGWQ